MVEGVAVSRVVIYNRIDCCAERLSNSVVSLLNHQGNTLKTYRIGDATNVPMFDMNFAGINGVESPTQSPTTASTPTASPVVTERPTLAISSDANVVFWTTTDDFSEIYLNGVMVGSTNDFTMPFSFSLTGKLLNGYNVIAVAAHDAGSVAAMQAQLVLAGTSVLVGSSSTGWKYSLTNPTGWADATFNDSSWLTPVAKSQSSEPWGNKMPINDGSAGWIWSTDPFSHNDVYFRIGFMYTARQ